MNIFLVYITTGDKAEARTIGRFLVESKLAACVNIFDNMNAMYVWQGQFHDDQEAVMIAKTTQDKVQDLIESVKARHSYECPCIVTLPIADGYPGFLNWVAEQVAPTHN
jgi:periplasmic divalent cation tolerance protein